MIVLNYNDPVMPRNGIETPSPLKSSPINLPSL